MNATIDAVLNRVRTKVHESKGKTVNLTYTQAKMILDYIDELKDTVALYNNIIAELSAPQHVELTTEQVTSDPPLFKPY